MDDQLQRIEAKLDALSEKAGETHTALFTRGGGFDRLDAVEKKASDVCLEVSSMKAKVAFAATCVSSLVAIVWAIIAKFWNPQN